MNNKFYHGQLNFKGFNFTYLLEDYVLTLYPKEDDKELISKTLFYEEIKKGVYTVKHKVYIENRFLTATIDGSDYMLIMLFQEKTRITRNSISRLHDIVLYLPCVAYAVVVCDKSIDRFSIGCDELNYIYPVKNFVKLGNSSEEVVKNGVFSLETLDFKSTTSKSAEFRFNNYIIEAFFSVSRYIKFNSPTPLSLDSYLNFNIREKLSYIDLIDVFFIADDFLKFMCYRKNINYNSIKLFSKNNENQYEMIGNLFVNVANREIEKNYVIENKFIPFNCLEGNEERIFKDITKGFLYNRHYPSSSQNNMNTYPSRFVLITSAFEWEYKQNYKNKKKEKSLSRRNAEQVVSTKLDELSNDSNYSRKTRRLFKNLKDDIERISLAEKIKIVSQDYANLINYFGNKIYRLNDEKYDIDKISKRLSKQRNDYAHGNLDEKVQELSFLDLHFIEIVVYIMQMSHFHISEDSITCAIEKLFF